MVLDAKFDNVDLVIFSQHFEIRYDALFAQSCTREFAEGTRFVRRALLKDGPTQYRVGWLEVQGLQFALAVFN